MAYGFNDDKSKVEIPGIKILTHTFTTVPPYNSIGNMFSQSELANLGIDDIRKYMVIGVSQQVVGEDVRFNSYYIPKREGNEHHYLTRPCVTRTENNRLLLTIYNNTGETVDIIGKVMLMEIM